MFSPTRSAHRVALGALALLVGVAGGCDASGAGARGAPPDSHDTAAPRADRDRSAPDTTVPTAGAVEAADDRGRRVRLPRPAQRVVSLVPGATETLVAIGAVGQLAGRTRYDTAAAVRHVPSVGAGLDPSVEAVLALRPDLVITWSSDAGRGFGERLEAAGVPTFVLQTRDTGDVFRTVERVGTLAGRDSAARALAGALRAELAAVAGDPVRAARPPAVLFVAWPDPPITAGRHMLVPQIIGVAGGRLAFPDLRQDSPQLSMEAVVEREPDVVLVTVSEGGRGGERLAASPAWRSLRAVREGRVVALDGDLVRPGPSVGRMARALRDSLRAVLARHPL